MFLVKRFWPSLILVALVLFFLSKLLFPPSFFSTPGDIAYFHLPLKTILSDSLKDGHLPLWTNLIGGGFPIFAESQIGALFLPNFILFSIFPLWLAFALSYILIFLVASISTYLFTRKIGIAKIPSLYGATAFSFSMFFISRIQHLHFIQVVSLMPLCFLFLESFLQTKKSRFLLWFSLILSQQLLAGFPQAVLYSSFAYLFYFSFRLATISKKEKIPHRTARKSVFFLGFFILVGFGLSSVQLIPTYELLKNSSRSGGLNPEFLFFLSGNPKTLITLAFPYFFGNPAIGTFNPTTDLGFYWENTAYSGITTLIFALLSVPLLLFLKRKKVKPYVIFFILLFACSLLFTMGKYGPFGFFFYLPPLSYFRIPSRFLFLTSFSMSILAALFLQHISEANNKKFKFGTIIVLILLIFDLFYYGLSYNPITNKNIFFFTPETVKKLKTDTTNFRISTLRYLNSPRISTQDLFWEREDSKYLQSFEALDPNVNARFNIESLDSYNSIETRRTSILQQLLASATTIDQDNLVHLSKMGEEILNVSNVKYIATTFKLGEKQFEKIYEAPFKDGQEIYLFRNTSVLPRAFVVYQYKTFNTIQEGQKLLEDGQLSLRNEVLLEKEIDFKSQLIQPSAVEIKKYKDQEITLLTNLKEPGILVLGNSYYPGWRAFMDGKELEIMPANINQQAVLVDKGKHEIIFEYDPTSFKIGIAISLLSIDLLLIVYLLSKKSKRFQKFSSINA